MEGVFMIIVFIVGLVIVLAFVIYINGFMKPIYFVKKNNTGVTITSFIGVVKGDYVIPSIMKGKPVTAIGFRVFSGSSLTSVSIPESVTNIGNEAFDCVTLENIQVAEGNGTYKSIDGILFSKSGKNLIFCPRGKSLNNYTIPKEVNYIADNAFKGVKLTEITIPESVTKIGKQAFAENDSLSYVKIGKGVDISKDAICKDFQSYYERNNKLAGLYHNPGARWLSEQESNKIKEEQERRKSLPEYKVVYQNPSISPLPMWAFVRANSESEAKREFERLNNGVQILSIERQ